MVDYKKTLNLPKTSFPMKANLIENEPKRLKKWYDEKIYQQIRKHFLGREKFILHDGPPYANGNIHVGHAVNKILKDIIIRSKTLSGFDAPYIPCWDCHGLPIELQVEKNLGSHIGADNFRRECKKYASIQVKRQIEDFKRLGILGDWDSPYLTMDLSYQAGIIRNLGMIINNGHVIRGFKPVHWCTKCGSALAEAEVEYLDKISKAISVKFEIVSNNLWAKCFGLHVLPKKTSVVIWTTTPWTLPANQAVAFNKHMNYAMVDIKHEGYIIIAAKLVESFAKRCNFGGYRIIANVLGSKLNSLKVKHPFYDHIVPLVHSDHVDNYSGTGIVHIAPAHGIEDFSLGEIHKLSASSPINDYGYYYDNVKFFGGKFLFEASDDIIKLLEERAVLVNLEEIKHSYPNCWRHKTPLIFRATPQWFINMDRGNLRAKAIEAVRTIEWFPARTQNLIHGMIKDRPDWCISRQRTWGVPIPLYVHKKEGTLHPKTQSILNQVAESSEKVGLEKAWFNKKDNCFIEDNTNEYERVTDTLDVWFDSGCSSSCVVLSNKKLRFPADLYIEGADQHRGWFQTSLLISLASRNKVPYKKVITHGFVVDESGKKMSKSLGNVISPQDIVNKLGSEILRLWVASTDYRNEMTISQEILKISVNTYRRLRNTARFLLSNLYAFNPKTSLINFEQLTAIDQWALLRASLVQEKILKSYAEYRFHSVIKEVHDFCSFDISSFYLDIIKDRQYTMNKDNVACRSAQTVMYHIIQALTRWISPVLCFTADEIYSAIPGNGKKPLAICEWYEGLPKLSKPTVFDFQFWELIREVRNECNKLIELKRAKGILGASLEADVILYADFHLLTQLSKLKDELRFVLIVSEACIKPLKEKPNFSYDSMNIKGLSIVIRRSTNQKCERCWHHCSDIGNSRVYPDICSRCIKNITTAVGETREFV